MITFSCPICGLRLPAGPEHGRPPCPACETGTLPPAQPANPGTLPPAGPSSLSSGESNLTLDHASAEAGPRAVGDAPPGYTLEGELGRGGMGVVYRARQAGLGRPVALKMILAGGHAGEAELARFRTEAEAIARLQHPNIVQIHEVGEHNGQPFFSLEFCPGGSLDKKLAGTPLLPREAAELVRTLARAMQAAHQANVIHRDLKPANVLLSADGTLKVTDFGLAKKLDQQGPAATQTGAALGTPSYMAPEQAEGKKEIGPAADIYALGAILYECLTGRPPFKAATLFDTLMQVVADEPVAPSQLQSQTPRDLETICLKCLAKEPGKRYCSAAELADDLGRYQAGVPIQARPVGAVERGVKWVRRNPLVASLAAAVVGVLLAGVGVSSYFGIAASREAEQARRSARVADERAEAERKAKEDTETQRKLADAQRKLAEERAKAESEAKALAQEATERAERNLERAEWLVYAGKLALAQQAFQDGNGAVALQHLDVCQWNLRGWEHRHLWTRFNSKQTLLGHTSAVTSVAFSPDGQRIASASSDQTVRVWDAQKGQQTLSLRGHTGFVTSVAFSPDGKRLASASGKQATPGESGEVKVWDAEKGQQVLSLPGHTGGMTNVAFSPDGKRIASASYDKTVKVWDAHKGQQLLSLNGHTASVTSVAFSPDSQRIASASRDQTVKVWDAETGQLVLSLKGHTGPVTSIVFSPDGKRIASASQDRTVKVWDAEKRQQVLSLQHRTGTVWSVAFSPDGKRLAGASSDQTVKVWDARDGQQVLSLQGHTGAVTSVAFSPDGQRIASASSDQTVKVWDADKGQEALSRTGHTGEATSVTFILTARGWPARLVGWAVLHADGNAVR